MRRRRPLRPGLVNSSTAASETERSTGKPPASQEVVDVVRLGGDAPQVEALARQLDATEVGRRLLEALRDAVVDANRATDGRLLVGGQAVDVAEVILEELRRRVSAAAAMGA